MLRTFTTTTICFLLAACATSSADIAPANTPLSKYSAFDCPALAAEEERIGKQIHQLATVIDKASFGNRVVMGVGMVFWPALFWIDGKGDEQDKLAQLKGELESVRDTKEINGCLLAHHRVPGQPDETVPRQ